MRHVITLQPPFDGTAIFICCSCSDEPIAKVGFPEAAATLVEINEVAHRHIEATEASTECTCSVSMGMHDGPHAAWCKARPVTAPPAFAPLRRAG